MCPCDVACKICATREKPHAVLCTHIADALAFRGRSPRVTKSSTHPSISSVKIHAAVLRRSRLTK